MVRRNFVADGSCVCGEPMATAMHVLCTCPIQEDIRDFETFSIARTADGVDVTQCLSTSESREALERFALEAFRTRYQLTNW